MLTRSQIDKKFAGQALKAAEALTPAHAAAEGGMDSDGSECPDEASRRRDRVQHEADPYLHEAPEVSEVDLAEVGKAYRQAFEVVFPDDYPALRPVDAERFRQGPVSPGRAANSPAYGTPGQPVPVPSRTLAPGMISRPALSDGQSRPCAPEAC